MSESESVLVKAIQKALINYLVGFGFIIVTSGIIFYFSMTYNMQKNQTDIFELKQTKADKAVMETELKNINGSLIRIETKLDAKD